MFDSLAILQSLTKAGAEKNTDIVKILHEKGSNDVIAEYKGVRYTAIFNAFVGFYYVDDVYGELPDQNKCPFCGEVI
jgi:hypothetical protein